MISLDNKTVILSKINQIGDVIMALPAATELKKRYPSCKVLFLARLSKTKDLLEYASDIDGILNWDDIEKMPDQKAIQYIKSLKADAVIHFQPTKAIARLMAKAKVRTRVGTARRLYHYLYCNYWVNVKRNGSNLHETELDMMLLRPFTRKNYYSKEEIIELRHFKLQKIEETIKPFLKDGKFNLIIHPKTRGEHIEWALSNYAELIKELPKEKFNILITGSQKEGQKIYQELIEPVKEKVTDLTGKTTLKELINLISHSDGLIAGSTGPIHIAAAFNINTLGLYAPIKPFHATRWGPVGKHAKSLSIKKDCHACRDGSRCLCVNQIKISSVKSAVLAWQKNKEKSLGESVDK